MLRIGYEMEKPNNLYVQLMDVNWGRQRTDWWREGGYQVEGGKGGKSGTTVVA